MLLPTDDNEVDLYGTVGFVLEVKFYFRTLLPNCP